MSVLEIHRKEREHEIVRTFRHDFLHPPHQIVEIPDVMYHRIDVLRVHVVERVEEEDVSESEYLGAGEHFSFAYGGQKSAGLRFSRERFAVDRLGQHRVVESSAAVRQDRHVDLTVEEARDGVQGGRIGDLVVMMGLDAKDLEPVVLGRRRAAADHPRDRETDES